MKWIRRIAWVLLSLAVLIAVVAAVVLMRSLPRLDGELRLPGLSAGVSVQRDAADVTHIKAQSTPDAWRTLGFVHAQERGWQLEFNRRVMHGELSEVLGEATLETDKLMRTLGIMRAAQAQFDGLPAEAKQALQAYSEGINAFHAGGSQLLSPEFHILGRQARPLDAGGQRRLGDHDGAGPGRQLGQRVCPPVGGSRVVHRQALAADDAIPGRSARRHGRSGGPVPRPGPVPAGAG